MAQKVVLAYSGGLDTTVAIPWLKEHYGLEVITLTVDLGQGRELSQIKERALKSGAARAVIVDGREVFLGDFVFPTLQAGAIYEGQYPLATALSRPLIARFLAEVALEEKADFVAHGCTGKGNDQVRFEVGLAALAPEVKVLAPAREWGMSREEEKEYARSHNLPLSLEARSPYSIDENLWGRSIEGGSLEDPWTEPPEDAFAWTRPVDRAPEEPCYIEVGFQAGIPVTLDGERLEGVALVAHLNRLAGEHGVGRIDHLENRLVGFKSREVYEAPAAFVLLSAHKALEGITLAKDQLRFKERVAQEYADLIYNGLWFSAHRYNLAAYVESTQRFVSGDIKVKLHKGSCQIVGRKSPYSLYQPRVATYGRGDLFDHKASPGFIHIWGLPTRLQAQAQPPKRAKKGPRARP